MLNSTPSDKRDAIVAEAKAYGYNLPILMDTNQMVGEQLGVTRTAEVIVSLQPKKASAKVGTRFRNIGRNRPNRIALHCAIFLPQRRRSLNTYMASRTKR